MTSAAQAKRPAPSFYHPSVTTRVMPSLLFRQATFEIEEAVSPLHRQHRVSLKHRERQPWNAGSGGEKALHFLDAKKEEDWRQDEMFT